MPSIDTISAAVIPILIECIKAKGVSSLEIESRTGIAQKIQDHVDIRIPIDHHLKLWEFACEVKQDPMLAINLREEYGNTRIHFVNTLATNSPNALEAVESWKRYVRIVCEAIQIKIEDRGEAVTIFYSVASPYNMNPWMPEHAFFQLTQFGRQLINKDFSPISVSFKHKCLGTAAEYSEFFDSPVSFDQSQNEIVCDKEELGRPLTSSNPHLQLILKEQADKELEKLSNEGSVSSQVQQIITRQLSTGSLDIETVAEALNISRTTLFRRLKAESSSYNLILTSLRKEFATEYMKSGMNVSQMAFLLGYSTASNFVNAFKRWFGKSPGSYRHSFLS